VRYSQGRSLEFFIYFFFISIAFAQSKTQNVILVTLDGARTQEIFGGLDAEVFRSTNKNFDQTAAFKRFERQNVVFLDCWRFWGDLGRVFGWA
jgi:hypothetical protein